ncbi:macrolide 2'-phosphotransferase [Oceanobacillus kimchii]|uniref:macrolide 2'-phosphotransferase n=1 Tax=Oceanobacillus kimchii TaxID=746691 RepID=UPI0021A516C1|nr:macrolide 2'-phosphotransferase [Oceanobacillus kimchii]MCT1576843.1 macrolide 2'-phosphotransferase [Oceanobacillus kimchii]MCT2134913.1 macrolide 2'-phosphotransferase [Oceanobacillus kimchii]
MDKNEVVHLARKHGIDVNEDTVKLNESGLDFQVAHVEDTEDSQWILRIPRRPDSTRSTDQEKRALDIIHNHVSFQVPKWEVYTNELIAYKQLESRPAGTIDPDIQNYVWSFDVENTPDTFHQTLGTALAELHQLPKSYFTDTGIEINDAKDLRANMKQRMVKVKEQFGVSEVLWERWQKWVSEDSLWPTHTGLIHGDVHPGHTMINDSIEVTGFIDWTEVSVTDISRDFVTHYILYQEAGLERLIEAYGNAGGKTWPKMKEHIIELQAAYAIDVAEFAIVSKSSEMEEMAKQMLGVDE